MKHSNTKTPKVITIHKSILGCAKNNESSIHNAQTTNPPI